MSSHQNPLAFPGLETFEKFDEDRGKYVEYQLPAGGMTLRDYFAATALPAIIEQNGRGECYAPEPAAEEAYSYADAMLKAREGKS